MNYIFPSIGTNNNSKNHNPSKNKSINKMISNSLYRKTKMLIKNYKIRYENNEQLSKYWPKAK